MPERLITLHLPDGFDRVLREHAGEVAEVITDELRRVYIATLLASIMDGLQAPNVADAFVRLNGGHVLSMGDHERVHSGH